MACKCLTRKGPSKEGPFVLPIGSRFGLWREIPAEGDCKKTVSSESHCRALLANTEKIALADSPSVV